VTALDWIALALVLAFACWRIREGWTFDPGASKVEKLANVKGVFMGGISWLLLGAAALALALTVGPEILFSRP
jgi:hypothetical protein